jgi:serine/threonine-protein kinase
VQGPIERRFDEQVPRDVVIGLAEGTPVQLPKGEPVGLVVSDGPPPRTVPGIAPGSNFEQAKATLETVRLEAVRTEVFSNTVPAGQVVATVPPAGTQVPRDSEVQVQVSKGVQVPNVAGQTVDQASRTLEQAGFVVTRVEGNPRRPVSGTNPPAGSAAPRGAPIVLITR